MTFAAVCHGCAQKLEVREFCTIGLSLERGSRCEGCGIEFQVSEGGLAIGYDPVTPDQLAEIRAKE